jgi:cell division protein FtsB
VKTHSTVRRKRHGPGVYILAFVAVLVVLGLVSSGRSLVQIYGLSRTKAVERKAGSDLEREKTRLQMEIFRLLSDSLYIEEIARKEYGMVKKGEEVFNISPPDTTKGKKNVPGK